MSDRSPDVLDSELQLELGQARATLDRQLLGLHLQPSESLRAKGDRRVRRRRAGRTLAAVVVLVGTASAVAPVPFGVSEVADLPGVRSVFDRSVFDRSGGKKPAAWSISVLPQVVGVTTGGDGDGPPPLAGDQLRLLPGAGSWRGKGSMLTSSDLQTGITTLLLARGDATNPDGTPDEGAYQAGEAKPLVEADLSCVLAVDGMAEAASGTYLDLESRMVPVLQLARVYRSEAEAASAAAAVDAGLQRCQVVLWAPGEGSPDLLRAGVEHQPAFDTGDPAAVGSSDEVAVRVYTFEDEPVPGVFWLASTHVPGTRSVASVAVWTPRDTAAERGALSRLLERLADRAREVH